MGILGSWPGQPRPQIGRGILRWEGCLRPTVVSPPYTVSLAYRKNTPPKVYVLEPILDPGLRDALPHVYDGDRLCLYTPGEWDGSMSLAKTILPWTCEWLLHYEVWRATDLWEGGGHVYAPADDDQQTQRAAAIAGDSRRAQRTGNTNRRPTPDRAEHNAEGTHPAGRRTG